MVVGDKADARDLPFGYRAVDVQPNTTVLVTGMNTTDFKNSSTNLLSRCVAPMRYCGRTDER